MIGVYFILTLSTSTRAQTYTPVPYRFPAVPSSSLYSYTVDSTSYNEGVDAMAANGYGLWLAIRYPAVWKLSGNGLAQEDPSANPPIPNGTLAKGNIVGDTSCATYPEVASNLLGSTRYVAVDNAGDGFLVSGFNDARVGGPTASHNISIAIPYAANDNLFNDSSIRKVITGPAYMYPVASAKVTGEPGGYSPEI
jgi:hypothetical protein